MRRLLIGCALLAWSTRASASEWHVLPTGSANGDGSSASPWDLATAASGAAGMVLPGDTVWVHAGTYGNGGNQPVDFTLSGTSAAPVVVRAARGERATIDGGVIVNGQWVTLWGLEITNSSTLRNVTANVGDPNARLGGVNLYGRGDRAINLVVHNTGHPAIGFWNAPGDGAEVYGCIIWGNGIYDPSAGFNGSPRGNGTYAQNTDGDRHITDNVSFRNWTEGLDAHSAGIGFVNGFHFEGNIAFDNPTGQITANTKDPSNPMERMHVVDNCTYRRSGDTGKTSVQLGYYNEVTNEDVTITGNYLVMGSDDDRAFHVKLWKRGTVTGNTIVSERYFGWWWNGVPGEALTWDQNRYHGGTPHRSFSGPAATSPMASTSSTLPRGRRKPDSMRRALSPRASRAGCTSASGATATSRSARSSPCTTGTRLPPSTSMCPICSAQATRGSSSTFRTTSLGRLRRAAFPGPRSAFPWI